MINVENGNIAIEKAFEAFNISFNRSRYFMIMIDNFDESHMPSNWASKDNFGVIHHLPEPKNKGELIDVYKKYVANFILRDCIEAFALALDNLFFIVSLHGKKVLIGAPLINALSTEEQKELKNFKFCGLSEKLKRLSSKIGGPYDDEDLSIIASMKDIRDCFSHHFGLVRNTDGKSAKNHKRKFEWLVLNTFLRNRDTGRRQKLVFGEKLNQPCDLCIELKKHCKEFKVNQMLAFTKNECMEILLTHKILSDRIIQTTIKHLLAT